MFRKILFLKFNYINEENYSQLLCSLFAGYVGIMSEIIILYFLQLNYSLAAEYIRFL